MSNAGSSTSTYGQEALKRARAVARRLRRRAVEIPLNIHPAKALRAVQRLQRQFPEDSRDQLARRIAQRRMWKPAAIGFLTGAPSNPWAAPLLAAADVGLGLRHHLETACQIAALYNPAFFDREGAHWELLVPLLGATQEGKTLNAMDSPTSAGSPAVRTTVRRHVLRRLQRLTAQHLGLLLIKKALLSKAIPIVGSAIGGLWGLADAWRIGDRIIDYFADKEGSASSSPPALRS